MSTAVELAQTFPERTLCAAAGLSRSTLRRRRHGRVAVKRRVRFVLDAAIILMVLLHACTGPAKHSAAPEWRFNTAQYDRCLNGVRSGLRATDIAGGPQVRVMVFLNEGARCMTAQGVDAIEGGDLIAYAHIKCCVSYLRSPIRPRAEPRPLHRRTFVFPVARYASCVAAVRKTFRASRKASASIARAIALLDAGARCTERAGLDRISLAEATGLAAVHSR